MWLIYWGKIISDYSAMRWPAPSGYHVPSKDEWVAVHNIWTALWGWNTDWTNFWIALKLPFAGHRSYSSASVNYQGSYGRYWSSSRYDASNANNLYIGSSTLNPKSSYFRTLGFSVRCFKDTPTIPTSSWTKLYWTSIESWWIFWSSADWLISLSSDWNTWYTIADKNLGATTVWNSGDTLSEANCGWYFQRWNNYMFPFTWTVTTSSTQVDASNYWPWNYYSSSTFITRSGSPFRRDTTNNWNLWWWETWVQQLPTPIIKRYYGWKIIKDIQWPAPYGFHVPSNDEWAALCSTLATTFSMARLAETMGIYLKIPMAWERSYSNANVSNVGSYGYYWSFTPRNNFLAYALRISPSNIEPTYNGGRASGESLRCFKDSPTIPTSSWTTLYDGSSVATGAWVFYNATDGLISVSWDWQTWYTIMDKNLWATTVYNYWDTLTDANCGYFYQWGNNYWFPHSWTVTTSSTQVDASNYWPWNYYSSNIFITYAWRWDTTDNRNLWWWVTKWQHLAEVIKVYKWNTLIREKS